MAKSSMQVRVDPENVKQVVKEAKANQRTVPGEVNYALRQHYSSLAITKLASATLKLENLHGAVDWKKLGAQQRAERRFSK